MNNEENAIEFHLEKYNWSEQTWGLSYGDEVRGLLIAWEHRPSWGEVFHAVHYFRRAAMALEAAGDLQGFCDGPDGEPRPIVVNYNGKRFDEYMEEVE